MKNGLSISHYCFEKDMMAEKLAMYSSDGDMLIVPQEGTLKVITEMGRLIIKPKEIIVVPRGIKFAIDMDRSSEGNQQLTTCRGWVAECFSGNFKIPDLGPIGSNGLANERDFEAPTAFYIDECEE